MISLLANWKDLAGILIGIAFTAIVFCAGAYFNSLLEYKHYTPLIQEQKDLVVSLKQKVEEQNTAILLVEAKASAAQEASKTLEGALANERAANKRKLAQAELVSASSCLEATKKLQELR